MGFYPCHWSWDSAVSIATGFRLGDWGQSSCPRRVTNFFHVAQTGSGALPASYPVGIGGSFQEVDRPGCEADLSSPSSAEVKKTWIYTSTAPYAFMA
jgi:hypothetical protein